MKTLTVLLPVTPQYPHAGLHRPKQRQKAEKLPPVRQPLGLTTPPSPSTPNTRVCSLELVPSAFPMGDRSTALGAFGTAGPPRCRQGGQPGGAGVEMDQLTRDS